MVLDVNGLHQVRIERVAGNLTDHYDPRTNVIRLSDSVYDNASTAAIGVAAHEAGHAIQYATHYLPIKLRAAIIPITNIGSKLAMPLILIGLLFVSGDLGGTAGLCGHRLLRPVYGVPAGDPAHGVQRQPPGPGRPGARPSAERRRDGGSPQDPVGCGYDLCGRSGRVPGPAVPAAAHRGQSAEKRLILRTSKQAALRKNTSGGRLSAPTIPLSSCDSPRQCGFEYTGGNLALFPTSCAGWP